MTKSRKTSHRSKAAKGAASSSQKKSAFGGVLLLKAGKTASALQSFRRPVNPHKGRTNNIKKETVSAPPKKKQPNRGSQSKIFTVNQEKLEFEKDYASLRERCHVRMFKNKTNKILSFQPATFQLENPPLSSTALVDAATDLVADGFKDLGSRSFITSCTSLSSDKVSNRLDCEWSTSRTNQADEYQSQNYFGVLQSNDDFSDQEDGMKLTPSLTFAPPMFQFHPQLSVVSDVDPDL
jgi:hypothetical protein